MKFPCKQFDILIGTTWHNHLLFNASEDLGWTQAKLNNNDPKDALYELMSVGCLCADTDKVDNDL